MRLCFLVEEQYRHDGMPVEVIRQLTSWGHRVDVLRPGSSLMPVSEAVRAGSHDAWILKTVSGGPGLMLLEAAAAVGLTTVNDARSIRGVRDKALASAIGRSRGLPVPVTYAAARWESLAEIPAAEFPLVVKPADGSSGRAVRLVSSAERLAGLAADVGRVHGLDLYGVDILLGPEGPVVVDVNDFPSFRQVPDAPVRVGRAILELARTGRALPDTVPAPVPSLPAVLRMPAQLAVPAGEDR